MSQRAAWGEVPVEHERVQDIEKMNDCGWLYSNESLYELIVNLGKPSQLAAVFVFENFYEVICDPFDCDLLIKWRKIAGLSLYFKCVLFSTL